MSEARYYQGQHFMSTVRNISTSPAAPSGAQSRPTVLLGSPPLPLFRQEAMEGQIPQSFADVCLIPPPRLGLVLRLISLMGAIGLCLLFFGSYTSRQHAPGVLLPRSGLIKVTSLQSGLVQSSFLREGAFVHEGDVLVSMSLDRSSTTIISLQLASSEQLVRERNSLVLDQKLRLSEMNQKNTAYSKR